MDRAAVERLYAEAHARRAAGDFAAAEALYRRACVAAPSAAGPPHNLGVVLHLMGDPVAAEAAFRAALSLDPTRRTSRAALGTAVLAQGRLREGFALREARLDTDEAPPPPPLPIPRWSGGDPAGRHIVVWPEEGFGDQIMFARFATHLHRAGAHLTWIAPPELATLFADSLPCPVIAASGQAAIPPADAYITSSSLAAITPALDPLWPGPYLAARRSPSSARFGICPTGNPANPLDRFRSLPPDALDELLTLPGALSLDPADTGARDFADTASILTGVGTIITVDTATAHVAAACGRPTWLLLPAWGQDWRWMAHPTRPSWYPNIRIFRQPSPGDWRSVVQAVKAAAREAG